MTLSGEKKMNEEIDITDYSIKRKLIGAVTWLKLAHLSI
jgi:hypothetical protein